MIAGLTIRLLRPVDDLDRPTDLIHAAYAAHKRDGLRYVGTHQTVDVTRERLAMGTGYVAAVGGAIIGTIVLRGPQSASPVPLYRDPHTWSFGQFAVAPALTKQGVGRAMHDHVVERARVAGAHRLALDTAKPAARLVAMYQAWGYEICGECDWRPGTNYQSTLMCKPIG